MIEMTMQQVALAMNTRSPNRVDDGSITSVSTDSRAIEAGALFFAIVGEQFDGHDFVEQALSSGASACVCARFHQEQMNLSEGAPVFWVDDTVEALGRLAAFYRREILPASTIVIAVTGSNGKTTTKCMIDHVLSAVMKGVASPKSFNNNIGVPLTLFLADADDRYVVAEVGTNAPGEIAQLSAIASPDVAVITSIGEAHLAGFGHTRAVADEKTDLLSHIRPNGLSVINVDRAEVLPYLDKQCVGKSLTVGTDPRARLRVGDRISEIDRSRFTIDDRFDVELPLPGRHHATNAAIAFAAARWFGLDPKYIIDRLARFSPPAGRTSRLQIDKVTIIDDTYNANPASMRAAIDTLSCQTRGRRVFVMGDMLELGDASATLHRQIVQAAIDARFEVLVGVGEKMKDALGELASAGNGQRTIACDTADLAGDVLEELLGPEDTVLLKGSRLLELDRIVARLGDRAKRKSAVA